MTTPQDAIRARRRLTNKFIAAHQADRLRPFFDSAANLIGGEGGLVTGAGAIVAAFAAQFADPDFIAYVRTPGEITLDHEGLRAAEAGTWVGTWRNGGREGSGRLTLSGDYLAVWKKVTGQWVIEQELYVTLSRSA
jgi:hypothetical protein